MTTLPDEYHSLTDLLVEVAGKLLADRGEFPPFAAAVGVDGEHSLYDAEGKDESFESDPETIELALRDGLARAAAAREIKAIGLCTHVLLGNEEGEREVLLVQLCHEGHESVNVALPIERSGNELSLGKPNLYTGTLRLFLKNPS